jgi:hypothetical protein
MESGVATRPLADLEAYRQRMARFMYQSGIRRGKNRAQTGGICRR